MTDNKKNQTDNKNNSTDTWKEVLHKIVEFVSVHRRYVIASVLLIAFCVMLALVGGKATEQPKQASSSGDPLAFEKNAYPQITKLIQNYYDACAKGDVEALAGLAMPISENEAAYIQLFSEYVKNYKIKNIYTQMGVDENSYLVSVEMEMNFKDIKTGAPGLDFFYVSSLEGGSLYIDNLYSQFNSRTKEYVTEEQIQACINKYENRQEVRELQSKIQAEYEDAVAADEQLDHMINSTIEQAVSEWMSTVTLVQNQLPPETILVGDEGEDHTGDGADNNTDDGSGNDEQPDGEPEDDPPQQEVQDVKVVEYVQTTSEVNLRKGASTTKDSLATLKKGVKLKVVNINVWGEWTRVETESGTKGYVRNDFLTTLDNEYTVAGQAGYPEKKQKLSVREAANLMTTMTKSGNVISSIPKDSVVRVITCYANGYSKVTCNGRTGYILTEVLVLE